VRSKRPLSLSTFDGRLLDGLGFCRKVYDWFDQTRQAPEGTAKLRLRPTKEVKRLVEELIPIARYIQARYREGRRIKVRWFSGSQPYDAVLWSSGPLVAKRFAPRRLLLEVTTSVHENEHLVRRLLHQKGGSFGVKGISRDRKTGEIISEPYVHSNDELSLDLADQIVARLRSKAEKQYPAGTVLIVNCVADNLILEDEWNEAINRVRRADLHRAFREVFLIETVMSYSATLHGDRSRTRNRHAA
jgi:hypothetical protein